MGGLGRQAGGSADQLQQKPQPQEYYRRYWHNLDKDKNKDQGKHFGPGIKDQISSQHPGDGATGPNKGYLRTRRIKDVGQGGQVTC